MSWKTINIFVSSTFKDMHAERDYLVKYVFPELRDWCDKRKLLLNDIDLRWGVTSADSQSKNTVLKCLSSIDASRPYFICFLGQRRGWIPEFGDVSDDTFSEYGAVHDFVGTLSVTEIEIEHALLSPMIRLVKGIELKQESVDHALFFFRDNPFGENGEVLDSGHKKVFLNDSALMDSNGQTTPEQADAKLTAFKEKINNHLTDIGKESHVIRYDCEWNTSETTPELLDSTTESRQLAAGRLVNFNVQKSLLSQKTLQLLHIKFPGIVVNEQIPLKFIILANLMQEIELEYPDRFQDPRLFIDDEAQNRYLNDKEQQEIFAIISEEGYVHTSNIENEINEYLLSDKTSPMVISAESGLGKTTLLAHWYLNLYEKDKVIIRFCGVSEMATDSHKLLSSIFFPVERNLPNSADELREIFPSLLDKLVLETNVNTIIIDAIDQLFDGIYLFEWLSRVKVPTGLKLIISIKEAENTIQSLRIASESTNIIKIMQLNDNKIKKSIITNFLNRSLKALDDKYLDRITQLHFSANPLFLKILLTELKSFGSFAQLEDEIAKFGDNIDLAFQHMFNNLEIEQPYGTITPKISVPFLFSCLAIARNGLSEIEILSCFQKYFSDYSEIDILDTIRYYRRRLRSFLVDRNGRIDYLYDTQKKTATLLYGTSHHKLLAEVLFHFRPNECIYHARKSKDFEYLSWLYKNIDFIERFISRSGAYLLLNNMEQDLRLIKIDSNLLQFIRNTYSILDLQSRFTAPLMVKELTGSFQIEARSLCEEPWLNMTRVNIPFQTNETALRPVNIIDFESIDSSCAAMSKEIFLLNQNKLYIVDINSLKLITFFTINTTDKVEKVFCNSNGDVIALIYKKYFDIIKLSRNESGQFISYSNIGHFNCKNLRFKGSLVFNSSDSLLFQTDVGEINRLQLDYNLEFRNIITTDSPLSGYFDANGGYYLIKRGQEYQLISLSSTNFINTTSSIRQLIDYNKQLIVFFDDRFIGIYSKDSLKLIKMIETDFVPYSVLLYGNSLLISDEHGCLYMMEKDFNFIRHGMLSITWDQHPTLYKRSESEVLFVSNSRYAIVSEVLSPKFSFIRAKLNNDSLQTLSIDSDNFFRLHTGQVTRKFDNPYSQNLYGATASLNIQCDWNDHGDILFNEIGKQLTFWSSKKDCNQIVQLNKASCIVNKVIWLEKLCQFAILMSDGSVLLMADGRINYICQSYSSSVNNYLLCDCGDYFCVVTRRRLVENSYEETAVALFDRHGKIVFEEHYSGVDAPIIDDIAYDPILSHLLLISTFNFIKICFNDNFSSSKVKLGKMLVHSTVGSVALNGVLFITDELGLCAIDSATGKMLCSLPSHRQTTNLCMNNKKILVIENNDTVFSLEYQGVN